MNRRNFLRTILGTAVVASTNPVHFLAPPCGWMRGAEGIYTNGPVPGSHWQHKTPTDIMADIDALLKSMHAPPSLDHLVFPRFVRNIKYVKLDGTLALESDDELRRRIGADIQRNTEFMPYGRSRI